LFLLLQSSIAFTHEFCGKIFQGVAFFGRRFFPTTIVAKVLATVLVKLDGAPGAVFCECPSPGFLPYGKLGGYAMAMIGRKIVSVFFVFAARNAQLAVFLCMPGVIFSMAKMPVGKCSKY
jgi:hypothetical protein